MFTSHPVGDNPENSTHAEIYVMNPDGSGRHQLTHDDYEERGPSWSPDGTRIVFSARIGGPDFEICVMNADGSDFHQLTDNTVGDLSASWSPDGKQIAFHRILSTAPLNREIFTMTLNPDGTVSDERQVTDTAGLNAVAQWGEVRTHVHKLHGVTPGGPDQSATNEVETARGTFLSDGTQPANIALFGQYAPASFVGPAGVFGEMPTYDSPPVATLAQTLAQQLHS